MDREYKDPWSSAEHKYQDTLLSLKHCDPSVAPRKIMKQPSAVPRKLEAHRGPYNKTMIRTYSEDVIS